MTTDRFKRFVPLAVVLACWLALTTLHLLHQNEAPVSVSIPPCRSVVLLVVPGLNADDWNQKSIPAFGRLFVECPFALFPVPPPLHRPQSDNLSPDARLALACQMLVGKTNGFSVKVLDATGAVTASLENNKVASQTVPDTWSITAPEAVGGQVTDPARFVQAVHSALSAPVVSVANRTAVAPVLVVAVLDDVYRADMYAPLCLPQAAEQTRQNALRRVSQTLSTLTYIDDPARPDTVLLVAPLPSALEKAENERTGFLLLWQRARNDPKGATVLLTAPSTRHTPGLVAFGDIPATLAPLLSPVPGIPAGGRPITTARVHRSTSVFETQAAHWAAQWRETRLLVAVPWILAGLLVASFFWNESRKTMGAFCALLACALPTALWIAALVPLLTGEGLGTGPALYAIAALLAGCAAAVPIVRRNPAGALQAITGVTVCVLALDVTLGGSLLSRSPLSYSPLEGARFYGVGNEAAGVFLGASLVFALLCGRQIGFGARLLGGLGITAIFGLPTLGADAGGAIAALAGWGTLLVLDLPHSRRKPAAVLIALCAVLLLAGLAVWESRRPLSVQTHLGQIIAQTQTEGARDAASIALRKVAMNVHLSVSSPWAVLFFVESGLCFYLWRKAKRNGSPPPNSIIALFVGTGAAFAANDSGVVMGATCLLFGPPLLLLLSERAKQV